MAGKRLQSKAMKYGLKHTRCAFLVLGLLLLAGALAPAAEPQGTQLFLHFLVLNWSGESNGRVPVDEPICDKITVPGAFILGKDSPRIEGKIDRRDSILYARIAAHFDSSTDSVEENIEVERLIFPRSHIFAGGFRSTALLLSTNSQQVSFIKIDRTKPLAKKSVLFKEKERTGKPPFITPPPKN